MRGGAVRSAGRWLGFTVATGVSATAGAQSAQTGMTVSTGLSAESNPYNAAGNGGGGVAATAELQPQAVFRGETSTLSLSGLAQFRQFFRRYGLEDNYAGNAALTARQSDRLTLRATGGISYNEGGYGNYGRPGLSPLLGSGTDTPADPTTLPNVSLTNTTLAEQLPLLTDATVLGLRTRTTAFQGGAGFDAVLGARSNLSGDIGARGLRFKSGLLSDYNGANTELRYSRTLNGLSSVGLIGNVDLIDYRATRFGDTLTKSVLLSYDRRFGSGWALSVAGGASFSSITQLAGQRDLHLTAFSARGRFCKQSEFSQLCVSGSRSPQPSGAGAVRITDAISADYTRRLSERQSVGVNGSYARTERWRGIATNLPAADFATGAVRYDNQLRQRMTFYISGSVAKTYSSFASRSANFGIAAGIQFRFGGLK